MIAEIFMFVLFIVGVLISSLILWWVTSMFKVNKGWKPALVIVGILHVIYQILNRLFRAFFLSTIELAWKRNGGIFLVFLLIVILGLFVFSGFLIKKQYNTKWGKAFIIALVTGGINLGVNTVLTFIIMMALLLFAGPSFPV